VAPLNTTQRQIRIRYDEHFDEKRINNIKIRGVFNLLESFDLRTFIKRKRNSIPLYQIYNIKFLK